MGVWAWALPPQVAAPLAVFGALLGQVTSFASIRGGFDLKRIAPLIVGGALGVPLGVFLLHNADPLRFKLAIGALLTPLRPLWPVGPRAAAGQVAAASALTPSPA